LFFFSTLIFSSEEGWSGVYGPLAVGIDKQAGLLTGYFESHTGWDQRTQAPRFSCVFILAGKAADRGYDVSLWHPLERQTIRGRIHFLLTDGTPCLHLLLEDIPGGCPNVFPFDRDKGNEFPLDSSGDWIQIRVVCKDKAYFYQHPGPSLKQKSYVVRNDVLRIHKSENGWVLAQYIGQRTVRGWIREIDLEPLEIKQ
jgi:hypothetical protein